MAVALTFGRRGMALLRVSASDASSGGERVRSAAGTSEGLSNELYERVQRPSAPAYSAKVEQIQLVSPPARSRHQKRGPGDRAVQEDMGGASGRNPKVLKYTLPSFALSRAKKTTAP